MIELLLIRTEKNEKQTIGTLFLKENDQVKIIYSCKTLELAWKNNQKDISCIPTGIYKIEKRTSEKYGNHFHVTNVTDRDMILIHAGNYNTQTHGCILVGEQHKDINNDGLLDVTNSKKTLEKLNDYLPENSYNLIIK